MAAEARAIVPRLAHHPSLAIWCGGNELDGRRLDARARARLRDVVHELDPGRAWLPTSPLGADDVHGPWEHQGLRAHNAHYDGQTSTLHSEFGVEGMTNRAALEALIARGAPLARRPHATRSTSISARGGTTRRSCRRLRRADRGRRDDAARVAVAAVRRAALRGRGDARAARAGSIPWQLNESFPNAWCTAAVDWHGDPEAGVLRRRARLPRRAERAVRDRAWGGHDRGAGARRRAARAFVDLDGTVVAEADGGELAAPLDAFAHDVFLLDLEGRNRYVMTRTDDLAPLLGLPPTELRVELAATSCRSRTSAPSRRSASCSRMRGRSTRPAGSCSPTTCSTCCRARSGRSASRAGRRAARGGLECSRVGRSRPTARRRRLPLRGRADRDLRRRRAGRRGHPRRARAARRPTIRDGSCRASSTARTAPESVHAPLSRASRRPRRRRAHGVGRWSFRADRCATPAVFARGGGLVTTETSPLGQSGVGFAYRDGRPAIWLDFPYREEPLRYDGSETPAPPDVRTYRWQPGERVELASTSRTTATAARAPRAARASRSTIRGWVSVDGGGRARGATASTAGTTGPTRRG